MKFSTKSTYGLRAMIILAENYGRKLTPLSEIAQKEGISQPYLERIFASLKKKELVKAAKGSIGGYELACQPNKIDILAIISALEGELKLFYCLNNKDEKHYCAKQCDCRALKVLQKTQVAVESALKSVKLSELT